MTDDRCKDCEFMQPDKQMRRRCYSPQLRKVGMAGIIINFERDDTPEDNRSAEAGTGKCGSAGRNFKRRTGVF